MMARTRIALGALLVILISGAAWSAPVAIDFWGGWTGPDANTMQGIVDKFNKSQADVQVNFMSLQWTPLYTKFLTEMKGGNPPDILAMHGFEVGVFVELGVLDPGAVKSFGFKAADFTKVTWDASFYKGVQYAAPLDVNMHGLYYNKDLLAKAGIKTPPRTGAELIADAIKLTVDKNGKHPGEANFDAGNVNQFGLGLLMNHHGFYQFLGLISQENANPFNQTQTSVKFDQQKAVKAWGFLQDLVFKYQVVPKGEKSPVDDFIAGTVAMFIDGPWQLSKLLASPINLGATRFPKVFDTDANWGATEVLTFPLRPKVDAVRQQAAKAFVSWLEQNSGEWAKSGQLPASQAGLVFAKTLPMRQAFIDSIPTTAFLPAHPLATKLFSSIAPSPILTASQDALLNDKDPSQVTQQLEKDLNEVFAQQ